MRKLRPPSPLSLPPAVSLRSTLLAPAAYCRQTKRGAMCFRVTSVMLHGFTPKTSSGETGLKSPDRNCASPESCAAVKVVHEPSAGVAPISWSTELASILSLWSMELVRSSMVKWPVLPHAVTLSWNRSTDFR